MLILLVSEQFWITITLLIFVITERTQLSTFSKLLWKSHRPIEVYSVRVKTLFIQHLKIHFLEDWIQVVMTDNTKERSKNSRICSFLCLSLNLIQVREIIITTAIFQLAPVSWWRRETLGSFKINVLELLDLDMLGSDKSRKLIKNF